MFFRSEEENVDLWKRVLNRCFALNSRGKRVFSRKPLRTPLATVFKILCGCKYLWFH